MPLTKTSLALVTWLLLAAAATAGAQEASFEFIPGAWPSDLSEDGSTLALHQNGLLYLHRDGQPLQELPIANTDSGIVLNTDGTRMLWPVGRSELRIGTGWDDAGGNTIVVPLGGVCAAPDSGAVRWVLASDEFEHVSALSFWSNGVGFESGQCWWHGSASNMMGGDACGCGPTSGVTNCGRVVDFSSNGEGSILAEYVDFSGMGVTTWMEVRWPSGECTICPRFSDRQSWLYDSAAMSGEGGTVMFSCVEYGVETGNLSTVGRCRAGLGCWEAIRNEGFGHNSVNDISADGRLAVGTWQGLPRTHWLWRPGAGQIDLALVVSRCGLDPSVIPTYGTCEDMSADGRTLVGHWGDSTGRDGTWILRLPAFPRSDLDWNFTVDSDDVITFFANYEAGDADYDDNGTTNSNDLWAFFADWDSGL